MTHDIFVHLIDIPGTTNEVVCPNEDGSYSVFIDASLSDVGRKQAYEHALRHIKDNDFEKEDVQFIEAKAHDLPAHKIDEVSPTIIAFEKYLKKLRSTRKAREKKLKKLEERNTYLYNLDPEAYFTKLENQRLYRDGL